MQPEEWAAIGINVIMILAGAFGVSMRVTWKASQIKADILASIADHAKEDGEEFTSVRNEIDTTARSFGESFAAIREKIREVELFGRDTYMRRESFYKTMEMLSSDLKSNFLKIETRLDRMETKIDSVKGND
jgi:hypothetical protein